MAEEDRAMKAREAKRLANKIAYRKQTIERAAKEIPALEARHQRLLDEIADDYAAEHDDEDTDNDA